MNIFGIGGSELVLIILIMLVVAGPKRMIRWAYYMGRYTAKLRKMWEEAVDVMQQEVDAAGLDIEIPKELPTRQNISKVVSKALKPYAEQVHKELEVAQKELEAAQKPLQETVDEANKSLKESHQTALEAIAPKSTPNGKVTKSEEEPANSTNVKASPAIQERLGDQAKHSVDGFGAWSNPQHPSQQTEQKAK